METSFFIEDDPFSLKEGRGAEAPLSDSFMPEERSPALVYFTHVPVFRQEGDTASAGVFTMKKRRMSVSRHPPDLSI